MSKTTAPVGEPQWLKLPHAVHYTSLSRSKLYELIDEGKIRSVCLRDKDKARGTRLIYRPSLDAYLFGCEGNKGAPVPGRKGRKSKKEKEKETIADTILQNLREICKFPRRCIEMLEENGRV